MACVTSRTAVARVIPVVIRVKGGELKQHDADE
jgi:hypothetical protein